MDCVNVEYERGFWDMGNKDSKKRKKHKNSVDKADNETLINNEKSSESKSSVTNYDGETKSKSILQTLGVGFLKYGIELAIAIIAFTAILPYRMNGIEKDIKAIIETSIPELKDDIAKMGGDISSLRSQVEVVSNSYNDLRDRTIRIEDNIISKNVAVLSPIESMRTPQLLIYKESEDSYSLNEPLWNSTDIIAMDESGQEYSAIELTNAPIILSYTEGDQETVFFGQFNEFNQWDGNCIINVYENDNLKLIMDAIYDNGVVKKYRQVLKGKSKAEEPEWLVSRRVNEGSLNSGDTQIYERKEEYIKGFEVEKATYENVISVEKFEISMCEHLIGYYHGNTSNGKFNDITGEAYIVKYFEDGTVRTLYQGNFKNGDFDDKTGNAWYIVKNDNTNYMYYKGEFEAGNTLKNEGSYFENDLTLERIEEIINGKFFNCDINWDKLGIKPSDTDSETV